MSEPSLNRSGDSGVLHFPTNESDPFAVVRNRFMSVAQKRALLADWASDRRAVRNYPALRRLDNGELVQIDDVLEALKRLDATEDSDRQRQFQAKTVSRNRWSFGRDDDDDDPPPAAAAAVPWKPMPPLDAKATAMVA